MVRQIVTSIEELTRPCAKTPAELVDQIRKDLIDTAKATRNCAGLAAPQIGYRYAMFIMKKGKDFATITNPTDIKTKGQVTSIEGCLSRPGISARVLRPHAVTAIIDGRLVEFKGQDAKVFMHEADHLDGKVIGIKQQEKAA